MIHKTLAGLPPDATMADKRRALREAYPFGERARHPYKVWCREVRIALGLRRRRRGVRIPDRGQGWFMGWKPCGCEGGCDRCDGSGAVVVWPEKGE